jgi:hypothetical protein
MATVLENLESVYAQVAAELAFVNAVTTNPKPTYTIDGETWNWTEYRQMLMDRLATLKRAIQDEGGPYIVMSKGVT